MAESDGPEGPKGENPDFTEEELEALDAAWDEVGGADGDAEDVEAESDEEEESDGDTER